MKVQEMPVKKKSKGAQIRVIVVMKTPVRCTGCLCVGERSKPPVKNKVQRITIAECGVGNDKTA